MIRWKWFPPFYFPPLCVCCIAWVTTSLNDPLHSTLTWHDLHQNTFVHISCCNVPSVIYITTECVASVCVPLVTAPFLLEKSHSLTFIGKILSLNSQMINKENIPPVQQTIFKSNTETSINGSPFSTTLNNDTTAVLSLSNSQCNKKHSLKQLCEEYVFILNACDAIYQSNMNVECVTRCVISGILGYACI